MFLLCENIFFLILISYFIHFLITFVVQRTQAKSRLKKKKKELVNQLNENGHIVFKLSDKSLPSKLKEKLNMEELFKENWDHSCKFKPGRRTIDCARHKLSFQHEKDDQGTINQQSDKTKLSKHIKDVFDYVTKEKLGLELDHMFHSGAMLGTMATKRWEIQDDHLDYKFLGGSEQLAPFSMIVPLEDGTVGIEVNLEMWKHIKEKAADSKKELVDGDDATKTIQDCYGDAGHKKESQKHLPGGILLRPDHVLLFRGNLPHAGGACYCPNNLRAHAYFNLPGTVEPPTNGVFPLEVEENSSNKNKKKKPCCFR